MRHRVCFLLPWCLLIALGQPSLAAEPLAAVTAENFVEPSANLIAEPVAAAYSLEQGKQFLDSAVLTWHKQRDCIACHTGYLYLAARPALGADDPTHRTVRQYTEELVTKTWPAKGPRWDTEVVMAGMALGYNDRLTSGTLHPTTRIALDRMWKVQREDGGVDWINCDWPPFESDDEFGATMIALAVSVAPDKYAETPAAQAGIEKLKKYLVDTPLTTLHHRAMLVWADSYRPGWLSPAERQKIVDELLSLQHEDGSWSIASLGNWQRGDDTPQDLKTGDGYATGLAIYLARRVGIPAADPRLAKGVAWLKANQRASGRWFTRSLHKDSQHYITHAGSNLALMALASCGALD